MVELFQMWALVEILGILFLPFTTAVFHRLPDRGWAFSKTLGLVVFTFCAWLLLTLFPNLPFSQFFLFNIVAFLLPASLVGFWWARRNLLTLLRYGLIYIIVVEGIFAGLVFGLGWLRLHDPLLSSPEMLMTEGILAGLLRNEHLPLQDVWLAGHLNRQYYYVYLVIAILARFLGQSASVVFNTGLCICAGLIAGNLFGLACNLVARTRTQHKQQQDHWSGPTSSLLLGSIPCGLITVGAGLLFGNLAAVWQGWQLRETPANYDWLAPTQIIEGVNTLFPAASLLQASFQVSVPTLAFGLLVLACALNLFVGIDEKGLHIFGQGGQLFLTLICTGLALGCLPLMSNWDAPVYLFIMLITLCLQQWFVHQARLSFRFIGNLLLVILTLAVFTIVPYLPFYLQFTIPFRSFTLLPSTMSSPVSQIALAYGLLLFFYLSLLLSSAFLRPARVDSGYAAYDLKPEGVFSRLRGLLIVCLLISSFTLPLLVPGLAALLIAGGVALASLFLLLMHGSDRAHAFTLLLGTAAFLAIGSGELFFLEGAPLTEVSRQPTLQTLFVQAWILLAIAAGAGTFFVWRYCFERGNGSIFARIFRIMTGVLWSIALIVVCVAGLLYPAIASIKRYEIADLQTRQLLTPATQSLDSLQALQAVPDHQGDYEAIRWLNEHVQGTPVIVEDVVNDDGDHYYGRISAFTGLPTIIGYVHYSVQNQLNWPGTLEARTAELDQRISDVLQIYNEKDEKKVLALLEKYQAHYLYVGPLERLNYKNVDLERFGDYMDIVYEEKGITIYKVRA